MIERQSAIQRRLADQQHRPRVAVPSRDLGEADQHVRIAIVPHVGEHRDRDLALVELVEQLRGTHHFQPLDAASAAARRGVEPELRQPQLGPGELSIITGRLLGGRRVGRARLLHAPHRFRRTALPISGPGQGGRIDAADADPGKMLGRGRGIVEEAQRDPAGGEFLLGLVDVAVGQCGITGDQIGAAVLAGVDHLARQQPSLDPPFVEIVQASRILRRVQHQLCRLGKLLVASQQLDPAENVAGVAVQLVRHRIEQSAAVGRLAVGRDPRFGQGDMAGAEAPGRTQRGLVLAAIQ